MSARRKRRSEEGRRKERKEEEKKKRCDFSAAGLGAWVHRLPRLGGWLVLGGGLESCDQDLISGSIQTATIAHLGGKRKECRDRKRSSCTHNDCRGFFQAIYSTHMEPYNRGARKHTNRKQKRNRTS